MTVVNSHNQTTTYTYYLYDGDQCVAFYNGSGTFQGTNTFGADGLVSRRYLGATTFYVFDERGNVSQRTSSTGSVTMTETYDAYGARTATGAQPDPWGYMGQVGYYNDGDKSLLLCTHRFYDPATGRFVTRDPIGYYGGVNLYGYTGNGPVKWEDESGFLSCKTTNTNEEQTSDNGILISDSDGQSSLLMPMDSNDAPFIPCGDPVPDPQDHCTSKERLRASMRCQSEGKSGALAICEVTYSIPGLFRLIHFECLEDIIIV